MFRGGYQYTFVISTQYQTSLSTEETNLKNSDVDWKADAFQRREYYKIEQGRAVAELIFNLS